MDGLHLATHTFATIIGIFLFIAVTVSLLRTIVVPRPLRSNYSDLVTGLVIGATKVVARTRNDFRSKDAILAWGGPLLILAMLIGWLLGYLLAYTFLIFGWSADHTFTEAARQAGSSLFTLGLAGAHTDPVVALDFMAAATGPIVIAMLIGFLPTVYSTYLDRERAMADLSLTAGDPVWAPEWIVRAQLTNSIDTFDATFNDWANWATSLRLTHTTYPVLLFVRSPRFTRHYVVTLIGLLDVAALLASLSTKVGHRSLFTMLLHGTQAFDSLYLLFFAKRPFRTHIPIFGKLLTAKESDDYNAFSVPAWESRLAAVHMASAHDSAVGMGSVHVGELLEGEEQPVSITREEFNTAVDMITESGFTIDRDLDEAWDMFRRIRSRYEYPAYVMAKRLQAVPAPWSGPRETDLPTMWPTSALEMLKIRNERE